MSSSTGRLLPQLLQTSRSTFLRHRGISGISGSSGSAGTSTTNANASTFHRRSIDAQNRLVSLRSAAARPFSTEIVPGVGKGKTSTGLVGIPVDHDAPSKLIAKNRLLLAKMAASEMPPTAQYYINVAQIANYRIQAALDHPDDPEAIEDLCQCGQVEELVLQADNEMVVLDMYLRERWWEKVKDVEVEYGAPEDDGGSDEDGVDWDEGLDRKDGADKK